MAALGLGLEVLELLVPAVALSGGLMLGYRHSRGPWTRALAGNWLALAVSAVLGFALAWALMGGSYREGPTFAHTVLALILIVGLYHGIGFLAAVLTRSAERGLGLAAAAWLALGPVFNAIALVQLRIIPEAARWPEPWFWLTPLTSFRRIIVAAVGHMPPPHSPYAGASIVWPPRITPPFPWTVDVVILLGWIVALTLITHQVLKHRDQVGRAGSPAA